MPGDHWTMRGESQPGWKRGKEGRLFDYGEFRHVVLALLGEQPRHGYDIIRAIEQRTGGAYCPSPGVVYPTLALLEDVGHVRAVTIDRSRNLYEITADGRGFLNDNKHLIDRILSRMQRLGSAQAGASTVIIAAMDGLKAALHASDQPWSPAEAQAVATIINSAAECIRALRKPADREPGRSTHETDIGESR